ncbi:MAG: response regulator [Candidatus Magnetoovum sp. WYHC-5]|nr:response regulator [Candidatus Magnetoovum sp. WYHC-5]
MIEDREIAELFKIESAEHLQQLESGLLHIEKNPTDIHVMEELFRKAHSIKGSARMLGVISVQTIAHHMEDIFTVAKDGKVALTTSTIEQMYRCVDAMREFVEEAVSGKPATISVDSILGTIAEKAEPVPKKVDTEISKKVLPSPSSKPKPAPLSEPEHVALIEGYKIDTIRVDTKTLDTLITHAGELLVTNTLVNHQFKEIADLLLFCNQWADKLIGYRSLISELEKTTNRAAFDKYYSFYAQEQDRIERLNATVQKLKDKAYGNNARLSFVTKKMEESVRNIRLLPLSTIFKLFPKMVRDIARAMSKDVELFTEGADYTVDKHILEEIKDPLIHMLRNAIDHAIEPPFEREEKGKPAKGSITLRALKVAKGIIIEVEDDGRGLDLEAIKHTALKKELFNDSELNAMNDEQIHSIIFIPGFSTSKIISDISGRGIGLDVVKNKVDILKGKVEVTSFPQKGCTFRIHLPTTLTTTRVFTVCANGRIFAIPVASVLKALHINIPDIFTLEGRKTINFNNQPITVAWLFELLELTQVSENEKPALNSDYKENPVCIIISSGKDKLGLLVDFIIDEKEVILKTYSKILKRVRNIAGAAIIDAGEVCMILNPADLIKSVKKIVVASEPSAKPVKAPKRQTILLVEDTITTRTLEKRILESAGYNVVTAVDGVDALAKLRVQSYDAIVSDIQMPNMDGLTLTAKIRQQEKFKELPIVLVTAMASENDKKQGIKAGANAYITKPAFDHKVFLDCIKRLL